VSGPAGAVDISYEGYSSKDAYLDAVRRADIANNEQLLANELKYAGMWTMERH